MNINDFLKVKKVRCVQDLGYDVTINKNYDVKAKVFTNNTWYFRVINDKGNKQELHESLFEPITDLSKSAIEIDTSADNADNSQASLVDNADNSQASLVDNADNSQAPHVSSPSNDDAPHVKPKFKVGDPVYLPNQAGGKILKIQDNKACHYPFFVDVANTVNNSLYELDGNGKTKYGNFTDVAVKATPENHALLCKLYPHIEFEAPPKPLTGSDLCRAMLDKGKAYILCRCYNRHTKRVDIRVIQSCDNEYFYDTTGDCYIDVIPINDMGKRLTEAVLDES